MNEAFLTSDDDFLERVVHLGQRSLLILPFLLVIHAEGRLDIVAFAALVAHKVNLQLGAHLLAVLVTRDYWHYTYIDVEATNQQLVVYDILHQVGLFVLTEIDTGIAQPHVSEVILVWGVDVFLAFDIITHRL